MLRQIGFFIPTKFSQEIWTKTKSTHLIILVTALAIAILIKKGITYSYNNLRNKNVKIPQETLKRDIALNNITPERPPLNQLLLRLQ